MEAVRNRFDWLAELGGATAIALAAGFAAFKLAPALELAAPMMMTASGGGFFALGLLVMRAVKPDAREHALADLGLEPIETAAADDCLLLDVPYEKPLLLED
ncbi:MAG TPA: hypothetical protein VM145_04660, partial [Sphingomicrobium sp.]|nr:hypothetical protein [Sphingomicrobium sp.]